MNMTSVRFNSADVKKYSVNTTSIINADKLSNVADKECQNVSVFDSIKNSEKI